MPTSENLSENRREDSLSALRPQEREIAEQKIDQLQRFVRKLCDAKEDPDESDYFSRVACLDSDITVMSSGTVDRLYDRVMMVCATSCFSSVSVESIVQIHALCEPSITASDQSSLFNQEDQEPWAHDLRTTESGLKASKLALTTMLEGREDRRIRSEDLVVTIIGAIKRTLELCIYPILRSRRSGDSSELFALASIDKDRTRSVLRLCTTVMRHLASIIGKLHLTDTAVNPIEYLALDLLTKANSDSDKDSVFGTQRFETLRQAAMEVLIQIFESHSDHQAYITNEILNNLEKLPDKGPNVRQFKSARHPAIMSVSALFMRFVQVAATNKDAHHKKEVVGTKKEEGSSEDDESNYESENPLAKKLKANRKSHLSARSVAQRLMENARGIASRIATVLTDRALNVAKTGDKPFRNLLEMFIEDFCSVLGSPEWPAATVLLSFLLIRMSNLLSQSNKDMALALMGTMGCGIIEFKLRVKKLRRDLDISQSQLSSKLDQLAEAALENDMQKKDLLGFKGPYRIVIESLPDYLKVEAHQDDPHLLSIRGCYVTFWLEAVNQILAAATEASSPDQAMSDLRVHLESMIIDPNWLSREYKFHNVSEMQSQLAAGVLTLQQPFCQAFNGIVNATMKYTQSDTGATLKSKAIKNIESFLNKDSQAIPEGFVMGVIRLLKDTSPLVRESAVSLVSKCLEGNPALEQHCLNFVRMLTTDPSNGPKKRAINLLKKIYLRSQSEEHRIQIIESLLLPSRDHEKAIADIAYQALEDIWLKSLDAEVDENHLKLRRVERSSLLVQTVQRIQDAAAHVEAFEKFFAVALAEKTPNSTPHRQVCKSLVADMVEGVINPESMAVNCSQDHILQTLSIFAKVSPEIFDLGQLQLLKVYLKDLKTVQDLKNVRPTVTIFRFVLPKLPNLQTDFATDIWEKLSRLLAPLATRVATGDASSKDTLLDIVHCSWTVSPLAKNGIARQITVVLSTLVQLQPLSCRRGDDPQLQRILISYLILTGLFGRVCNFDEHVELFNATLSNNAKKQIEHKKATQEELEPLLAPNSPSVRLLGAVRPFTKQTWNLTIREHALSSLGDICQGSPALFMRSDVEATFKVVFKNEIPSLKRVVLSQFYSFFLKAERRSDNDAHQPGGEDTTTGNERLGTTFRASDGQLTTNYLARKFLQEIVDIALKNDNELAVLATNIITSISRQGLVHPKECGPALIALGTSANATIAQNAAAEHKKIHDAHESMFEKEYMAAVKMAFEYQREVFNDPHGMIEAKQSITEAKQQSYRAKMIHVFNVLKGGNRKTLKKFIDNLCKQMDFELAKLKTPEVGSNTLLFARFCLENLALFDVPKMEDVAIITNGLENIVLKHTGPSVGVAIETEVPKKSLPKAEPQETQDAPLGNPAPTCLVEDANTSISDARLLQITTACIILQMMWETRNFVRKVYNLQNLVGRVPQKDFQKPTARSYFISPKELWERFEVMCSSLESRETMINRCHDFAELLEVDKDAQIGDEDIDEDDPTGYVTPDEGGADGMAVPTSGRGRKRKSIASGGTTPKRPKGRLTTGKKKRNSKTPDLDGWD